MTVDAIGPVTLVASGVPHEPGVAKLLDGGAMGALVVNRAVLWVWEVSLKGGTGEGVGGFDEVCIDVT